MTCRFPGVLTPILLTAAVQLPAQNTSPHWSGYVGGAVDEEVVAVRRQQSGLVTVVGHTDSSGADAYNQQLSQRRAESVQQFLVSQGIDRSRLEARGYGESRPVADNGTPAGRERNRRVEFNVLR